MKLCLEFATGYGCSHPSSSDPCDLPSALERPPLPRLRLKVPEITQVNLIALKQGGEKPTPSGQPA